MVDQIIKNLRLSNFDERKIRDTRCLLFMDENSGPNNIEEFRIKTEKKKQCLRVGKNLYDRPFYSKIKDSNYQKCNSLHENRLPQPYRDYENIIDPKSHFLTPGHDHPRHHINPTFKTDSSIEHTPQNTKPTDINSDRKNCPSGFAELNRKSENDERTLLYNGRERSLDACRASLRAKEQARLIGTTPDYKPPTNITFLSNAFPEFTPKTKAESTDDEIKALKFIYTSSTQKAYEDIPFDSYLHPRRWAPVSTLEPSADPIRLAYTKNKYYPAVNDWRKGVNIQSFEAQQLRPDHYLNKLPHDFCSPYPRGKHIPSYSGCISAYHKEDIDNPYIKDFVPLTVVRNVVPKFGDCVERPVFIGYTGKVKSLPGNRQQPFHTDQTLRNVLGQPC